jgi:hypothetical protein
MKLASFASSLGVFLTTIPSRSLALAAAENGDGALVRNQCIIVANLVRWTSHFFLLLL